MAVAPAAPPMEGNTAAKVTAIAQVDTIFTIFASVTREARFRIMRTPLKNSMEAEVRGSGIKTDRVRIASPLTSAGAPITVPKTHLPMGGRLHKAVRIEPAAPSPRQKARILR